MSIYDQPTVGYDETLYPYDGTSIYQTLPPPTGTPDMFENYSDWPLREHFFVRYHFPVGFSIWKNTDGWHSQRTPAQDDLDTAVRAATLDQPAGENGLYLFLGGHTYHVSPAISAELVAAGFPTG